MSQDISGQSPRPNPASQSEVPAPKPATPASDDKPIRLLTREEILKQIRESASPDRMQIVAAENREALAARTQIAVGTNQRAVGDNRKLQEMQVTLPFEAKLARDRECKRQARKHAALGDMFVRWAYADKKRRKEPFDADEFVKTSGRDKKEAEGIVNQMLIQKHFMLVGIEGVEDIEDSVEEATNRVYGMMYRLRKQNTVQFMESGLIRGKQLWWADRTKWLQPFRRVRKAVWVALAVTWLTFSSVVGLFGGIRECWKCVRHPITYFSEEADGQHGSNAGKAAAPAANPRDTAKPVMPITKS